MAGRVRHLNERNGRYEARLSVPAKLRGHIGKSEFVAALGGDRREALKRLPEAIARFRVEIRAAEHSLAARPAVATELRPPPVDPAVLALRHYHLLLRIDDEGRKQNPGFARVLIDDGRVAWLRDASAGRLADDELDECVGDVIRGLRARADEG